MPTPLEILLDPVSLAMLGIYAALITVEALFPGRPLPRVKGWHARALVVFGCYFFLSSYLPQQLSRDEIVEEVRSVIAETGASGPGDKNKVMPAAIARMKGKADGRAINEVVSELLGGG